MTALGYNRFEFLKVTALKSVFKLVNPAVLVIKVSCPLYGSVARGGANLGY